MFTVDTSMMFPSDQSRCHDDLCIQAPLCWRYTSRTALKWVCHTLTLREVHDRTGAQCVYFIPTPEGDPRDEPR